MRLWTRLRNFVWLFWGPPVEAEVHIKMDEVKLSEHRSLLFRESNGRVEVLQKDGRDIDPESPEGRGIIAGIRQRQALRAERNRQIESIREDYEDRMSRVHEEFDDV